MQFPKYLHIIQYNYYVENVLETGEVANGSSKDLGIVELLSKALRFSYKIYNDSKGDIFFGDLVLDEESCAYSFYPYQISEITFATAKPDYATNALAQFQPFSLNVWIGLLLSVVLMTFAHLLVFRGEVPLTSVFFYASVTLLGKYRNWRPKSNAQKLLILTWNVSITFLTLSYGSTILSFFTVPSREKGITNFNELYEAVVHGKATAVEFEDSEMYYALGESSNEKILYMSNHILEQETIFNGPGSNYLEVIKPNVAVISTRAKLEMLYESGTHFISLDSVALCMYVLYDWTAEGFCCKEAINRGIHRIWAAGLNQKNVDHYEFKEMLGYSSKGTYLHKQENHPIRPLSLSSMSGAFYFLIAGHILGLMCLTCEIITHHSL